MLVNHFTNLLNLLLSLINQASQMSDIMLFVLCFSSLSSHSLYSTFCFIHNCPDCRIPKVLHYCDVHSSLKMSVIVPFLTMLKNIGDNAFPCLNPSFILDIPEILQPLHAPSSPLQIVTMPFKKCFRSYKFFKCNSKAMRYHHKIS